MIQMYTLRTSHISIFESIQLNPPPLPKTSFVPGPHQQHTEGCIIWVSESSDYADIALLSDYAYITYS